MTRKNKTVTVIGSGLAAAFELHRAAREIIGAL
jgi:hypothetical protein